MTNEDLKPILIKLLWNVDLANTMSMYAPDDGVITISNILYLLKEDKHNVSKYRLRLTLKELIADGIVEYKSVGCPAVESCGEYRELICDAGPPINGYTLTKKGQELDICKQLKEQFHEDMRKLCEGTNYVR